MAVEVDCKHIYILAVVLLVCGLFLYVFLSESNSLVTGFVVMEQGVRVSTEKMDSNLVQEISSGNVQPRVVVILNDAGVSDNKGIEQKQEQVIAELEKRVEVVDLENVEANLAEENINQADFQVTHKFENSNAISGEVKDAQALVELTKNVNVKKILLDYPVAVNLDQSVPEINADKVWNVSVNGTSIDGSGQVACIIDTGIDYTHEALGGCNPNRYVLEGNVIDLITDTGFVPIESEHPYQDNYDHTWVITMTNFSNMALHFKTISLEQISNAGDTLDRIYVYDSLNRTIAVYKGVMEDVWTPSSVGDTIYVRLVSDGSVTSDGFFIDKVIDGTTNMTMNWSSCSKIAGGWDTYNNDPDPKDDHGHGTHVAGIIVSNDNIYRGVAPGAKIAAVKALSATGSGYSSDVIAALEWCVSNAEKLNISVISMSLGCEGGSCVHYQSFCNDDILAEAIGKAYDKNMAVFIAAGNSGWIEGISTPSCVEKAIPIGGVGTTNNILFNRGNLLRVLAPAYNIHSTVLNNGWGDYSGTSMATPHAAGAALLMNQYWLKTYGVKPNVEVMENKMFLTGAKVYDSASGLNFSKIDVRQLIMPRISFGNESVDDNIILNVNDSLIINVSSDVELVFADLDFNNTIFNMTSFGKFFSYQLTNFSEGNYSYYVYGDDVNGLRGFSEVRKLIVSSVIVNSSEIVNESIVNETVNETAVNNSMLTILVIAPINNSIISGNININYNVSGNNLKRAGYNLSNATKVLWQNWSESVNSSKFSYSEILENNYTHGNYTILFLAGDYFGNETFLIINFVLNNSVILESNITNETIINSSVNTSTVVLVLNSSVLEVGNVYSFEAQVNFSNGTYVWDFGDGEKIFGLSVNKQYNKTGSYDIVFNASNNNISYLKNLSVAVNDSIAPVVISINYNHIINLSKDTNQKVNVSVFDYSNINNITLTFNGTVILGSNISNNYTWIFNLSDAETTNFVINVTDNSISKNNFKQTFNFNIISCNDGMRNGDETGVDCGGVCGGCNVSLNASTEGSINSVETAPAVIPEPTEIQQDLQQNVVQTAALANGDNKLVIYDQKEVNWTTELKEAKVEEKKGILIGLGIMMFMLAFVYVLMIKKEL